MGARAPEAGLHHEGFSAKNNSSDRSGCHPVAVGRLRVERVSGPGRRRNRGIRHGRTVRLRRRHGPTGGSWGTGGVGTGGNWDGRRRWDLSTPASTRSAASPAQALAEPTGAPPPSPPQPGCPCTRRPGQGNSYLCPMGVGQTVLHVHRALAVASIGLLGQQSAKIEHPVRVDHPPRRARRRHADLCSETDLPPPSGFLDWSPVYFVEPRGLLLSKVAGLQIPWSSNAERDSKATSPSTRATRTARAGSSRSSTATRTPASSRRHSPSSATCSSACRRRSIRRPAVRTPASAN